MYSDAFSKYFPAEAQGRGGKFTNTKQQIQYFPVEFLGGGRTFLPLLRASAPPREMHFYRYMDFPEEPLFATFALFC